MFREDIKQLFDGVSPPPALEQRTEGEIIEMLNLSRRQKRNIRRTLCIAVVASLLVIGAALAAVSASGILDRIFPGGEPSEGARAALVESGASVSENGVTLRMDEYLMDGGTLHLGWTVSSEREGELYYTTSYDYDYADPADEAMAAESVGGFYGAHSSEEVGDNLLAQLSGENPSRSGFASYAHKAQPGGSVDARITVHAYETDYAPVGVESALDLCYADEGDALSASLEQARQIGVSPDGLTAINGYASFVDALGRLYDPTLPDADGSLWNAANEAAIAESGVFREIAVLELNVTVYPAQAAAPRFTLDGERRFELPGRAVVLRSLTVDAASTTLEYDVISDAAFDGEGNQFSYLLLDQDGNVLNVNYMLSESAGFREEDGKHICRVSAGGNPLPETVEAITFVPRAQIERMEDEYSNAYYLRMAALADPAECFTLRLN